MTYSLTDNAGGRFAINSSNGVVTVANGALLDYETAHSHNITVQATAGALSSTTAAPSGSDRPIASVKEPLASAWLIVSRMGMAQRSMPRK